jgi:ATP-dependent RNA helicase DeaD
MTKFEDFGLEPNLLKSLEHMNYSVPTPIQAQTIPLALDGRDILGSAQTGTGKTAAFAIPLINALMGSDEGTALVLTPTRELGKQVMEVMQQLLGSKSFINTAFIIGGEAMGKQFEQLKRNPRLIVGTPGRINDHLKRGTLKLDDTRFLVLDETDRMLDMGFSIQLDAIAEYMPKGKRQTLMFSATMPHNIMRMADRYLTNPKRIEIGESNATAKNIKQEVLHVQKDKKYTTLVSELSTRVGTILVFVNTKRETEALAKKLTGDKLSTEAIHGDLRQHRREKIIRKYRNEEFRVLIATDVIARGLDVPHIAHVINYDLPMMPEDYIHRIGRTARAGADGEALCLITPQDNRRWSAIQRLINPGSESDRGNYGERPRGKSGGHSGGHSGGKSFGNSRSNVHGGGKKTYGKKNFGSSEGGSWKKKPYGEERSSGYKGRDDRSSNNSNSNYKGNSDRPQGNGGSNYKGNSDRPFERSASSYRGRDERPQGNGSSNYKGKSDRPFESRGASSNYKGRDERPQGNNSSNYKDKSDRPFESRGSSSNYKGRDDRPQSNGNSNYKGRDERPQGNNSSNYKGKSDRPFESRGASSNYKGRDDRPQSNGNSTYKGKRGSSPTSNEGSSNRPFAKRSAGPQSFKKKFDHDEAPKRKTLKIGKAA